MEYIYPPEEASKPPKEYYYSAESVPLPTSEYYGQKEAAKTDDSYDKYVDKHQVELALAEPCVLGSRLAVWMLKEADLKVYLLASDDTRALRVFNREGGDLQQIKDFTAMRDSEDTRRYKEFYGIDNNDYAFCDIIIDVNEKTPEEIVKIILDKLSEKGLIEA